MNKLAIIYLILYSSKFTKILQLKDENFLMAGKYFELQRCFTATNCLYFLRIFFSFSEKEKEREYTEIIYLIL